MFTSLHSIRTANPGGRASTKNDDFALKMQCSQENVGWFQTKLCGSEVSDSRMASKDYQNLWQINTLVECDKQVCNLSKSEKQVGIAFWLINLIKSDGRVIHHEPRSLYLD